jgi:general stress protein 26
MAAIHSKAEVLGYLQKENTGVLATFDSDKQFVRQRVMYYGVDKKFQCYLMSTKESPKVPQIISTTNLSMLVFGLENPYDESWEVELNGPARMLESSQDIEYALINLKDRNPFADVALESGITRQFDFICLTPALIRFRIYKEALSGEPMTIIQLD